MNHLYTKRDGVYCCNCGKRGHSYKTCLSPIISYGIILYNKLHGDKKYLMIQRKDTIGFIEFMRGKYDVYSIHYITHLFKIMSRIERENILTKTFDELWDGLWFKNKKYSSNLNNLSEYTISKHKFNILKSGYIITNQYVSLTSLNNKTPMIYETPEWGFPKGRRNIYESDLSCAIREFEEETNIKSKDYIIHDYNKIFIENFFGTNNIKYRHVYYIAELVNDIEVSIDKHNIAQVSEIGNIKWYDFNTGSSLIRPYNQAKKRVFKHIHNYLQLNI